MFPCNNSETGGEHVFAVFPRPVYPKTSGVGDTPHASEYASGYSDLQDSTLRVPQRMLMRPALQMVAPASSPPMMVGCWTVLSRGKNSEFRWCRADGGGGCDDKGRHLLTDPVALPVEQNNINKLGDFSGSYRLSGGSPRTHPGERCRHLSSIGSGRRRRGQGRKRR